jgi:hypothetical protein
MVRKNTKRKTAVLGLTKARNKAKKRVMTRWSNWKYDVHYMAPRALSVLREYMKLGFEVNLRLETPAEFVEQGAPAAFMFGSTGGISGPARHYVLDPASNQMGAQNVAYDVSAAKHNDNFNASEWTHWIREHAPALHFVQDRARPSRVRRSLMHLQQTVLGAGQHLQPEPAPEQEPEPELAPWSESESETEFEPEDALDHMEKQKDEADPDAWADSGFEFHQAPQQSQHSTSQQLYMTLQQAFRECSEQVARHNAD